MPDVRKYMGNFLKASDFEGKPPMTVTIAAVVEQKVGREGEQRDRLIMQFAELEQALPLNSTNLKLCVKLFKSQNSNDWIGKKLVIKHDPTVSFHGNLVGGLRLLPAEG